MQIILNRRRLAALVMKGLGLRYQVGTTLEYEADHDRYILTVGGSDAWETADEKTT